MKPAAPAIRAPAPTPAPSPVGGARALFLTSLTALFCELMLIRWVSSEVPVLGYFKNFPLLAMFIGFGVGCLLAKRPGSLFGPSLWVLGGLGVLVTLADQLGWNHLVFPEQYLDVWDRVFTPTEGQALGQSLHNLIPIYLLLAGCAGAFLGFGQLIGRLLGAGPSLRMYSADIVGSLAGTLLFAFLSYLWVPPMGWILVAVGLIIATLLVLRESLVAFAGPLALLAATALLLGVRASGLSSIVTWSPYYRIEVTPVYSLDGQVLMRYRLDVNRDIHQNMLNLMTPESLARQNGEPDRYDWMLWHAQYDFPYRFKPKPAAVLIGGAGSGNDVAAAIRNGAGRVTAVEIDPGILSLGHRLHPEHPWASPIVTPVNNDIRAFFRQSQDKFDLIVLSILDSHTALSSLSSLRLDNYVYTVQSIHDAVQRLKPDGIMCLSFYASNRNWLGARMMEDIELGSGQRPVTTTFGQVAYFVFGPGLNRVEAEKSIKQLGAPLADGLYGTGGLRPSTDDWPYLYSNPSGQPLVYFLSLAALVGFGLWMVRWGLRHAGGGEPGGVDWEMLFLGAGFLLIETKGLTEMSLLFGSTWIVNTMVFSGVFVMVLLANAAVMGLGLGTRWKPAAFGFLAAALLTWFFFPREVLNALPFGARAVCGTGLVVLPLFFAGIIFATSFARRLHPETAFGSNLIGAVVGGAMEALSLAWGVRVLTLLALLFYTLAVASSRMRPAPERPEVT